MLGPPRWSVLTFVIFAIVGVVGGAAAYLVLRVEKRRRPADSTSTLDLAGVIGRLAIGVVVATVVNVIVLAAIAAWQGIGRDITTNYFEHPQDPGIVERIPWTMVIAFVAMLLGMVASYLNKLIDQRRAKIVQLRASGSSAKANLDFDGWDFVQPFLVSLITFAAIAARTQSGDLLTGTLLGFQTGFFWQSVLAARSTGFLGPADAATPPTPLKSH